MRSFVNCNKKFQAIKTNLSDAVFPRGKGGGGGEQLLKNAKGVGQKSLRFKSDYLLKKMPLKCKHQRSVWRKPRLQKCRRFEI